MLHLAHAARRVDHQVRHRQARDVAAQLLHELDAGLDRGAQVRGAGGDVALEEVVRAHAAAQKLGEELAQHAHRRVHAAQEHGLVAERDAGVGQPLARGARQRRQLLRVVEVRVDEQRVVASAASRTARRRCASGSTTGTRVPMRMISTCGIARSAAMISSRRDGRQRQRIAARDQHVADRRRAPDVVERAASRSLARDRRLLLADQAAPVAVAAVDRAAIEREQQARGRGSGGRCRSRASGCPRPADRPGRPARSPARCARGITCMRTGQAGWSRSMSEK